MSYAVVQGEMCAPPVTAWEAARHIASAVVRSVALLPELSALQADPFSLADGVVYKDEDPAETPPAAEAPKVTIIPPEDPQVVRERDKAGWSEAVTPHGHATPDGPDRRKASNKPRHS